jgi:hypothetical protein
MAMADGARPGGADAHQQEPGDQQDFGSVGAAQQASAAEGIKRRADASRSAHCGRRHPTAAPQQRADAHAEDKAGDDQLGARSAHPATGWRRFPAGPAASRRSTTRWWRTASRQAPMNSVCEGAGRKGRSVMPGPRGRRSHFPRVSGGCAPETTYCCAIRKVGTAVTPLWRASRSRASGRRRRHRIAAAAGWRRGPCRQPAAMSAAPARHRRCRGPRPNRPKQGRSTTAIAAPRSRPSGSADARPACWAWRCGCRGQRHPALRAASRRRSWTASTRRLAAEFRLEIGALVTPSRACRGSAGTGARLDRKGWSGCWPARGQGWPCRHSTRGRPGRRRCQDGTGVMRRGPVSGPQAPAGHLAGGGAGQGGRRGSRARGCL